MDELITIHCIDKCGGVQTWSSKDVPFHDYLQRKISERDISNIQVLEKTQGNSTITLVDNGEPTQELFYFMGKFPIYYEGRKLNWRSKDERTN